MSKTSRPSNLIAAKFSAALISCFLFLGCSTQETNHGGTLAGAVLGAGWGAGAGAIVGNQLPGDNTGPGAAVGAGLGAVAGALTGFGIDQTADAQSRMKSELSSLKMQNMANQNDMEAIQRKLDRSISGSAASAMIYQVPFGEDETDLKLGSISNLQSIADGLMRNPAAYKIVVSGHSDDSGTPDYNRRLSEARARTVASYLAARGISIDQIDVRSFGSTQPLASNSTKEGRQLNRRVEISIAQ